MGRRVAVGELGLAVAIAGLGLFFLVEAQAITVAPVYARIGPRFFPMLVGAGLCAAGFLLTLQALRGGWRTAPGTSSKKPEGRTDWWAFLLVSAGLLEQALLVRRVGFIPGTALLFFLVALGFGSRRYLRDAAIAILLAVVVYFGFTAGLELTLPKGPIEALF